MSFFPVIPSVNWSGRSSQYWDKVRRTIVTLGYSVLNSSPLRQVRYLRPVFIGVGTGAERTTSAVARGVSSVRGGRVVV